MIIQESLILSTSSYVHNECLKFYNINNFKCIKTIEHINIVRTHTPLDMEIFFENMIMLNKKILYVAGNRNRIYIIDISNHQLIKNY